MIELARGLTPSALAAIGELQQRTVEADGGRLKLEWGALNSRAGVAVEDLLFWQDGQLLGFLGLYAFGGADVELAGMVHPEARRDGIGTALLGAALRLVGERGLAQALLIAPRVTPAGWLFATHHHGVLEHSEHALVLTGPPAAGAADPRIAIRPAKPGELPALASLLSAAFDEPQVDPERLAADVGDTLVIERAAKMVGTMRVSQHAASGAVHGFAISPDCQGQGIGREALRRVCQHLIDAGLHTVALEVASTNDHALALYESLGFRRLVTEDYFAIDAKTSTPQE